MGRGEKLGSDERHRKLGKREEDNRGPGEHPKTGSGGHLPTNTIDSRESYKEEGETKP